MSDRLDRDHPFKNRGRRALFLVALLVVAPDARAAPRSAAEELQKAREAAQAKRYDEAITHYEKSIAAQAEPAVEKELADVCAWAKRMDDAERWYRTYLEHRPDDTATWLALGNMLSWSKSPRDLEKALGLFDTILRKWPELDAALLQRARVKGWLGRPKDAEQDFREYLRRHPDKAEIRLELGRALSWSQKKADIEAALELFDAHLQEHPDDEATRLQRARARGWAGRAEGAAADFAAYLEKHPDDAGVRLELARNLAWANKTKEAEREFEKLRDGPSAFEARVGLSQVYHWNGRFAESERELLALVEAARTPAQRKLAEVELSRVYSKTGRQGMGLDLIDAVVARHPDDEDAKKEQARQRLYFRPALIPGFSIYADRGNLNLIAISLNGRVFAHRKVVLTLDTATWRLANAAEALWTGRVDVGLLLRPHSSVDVELAGGPRFYEYFKPYGGVRAGLTLRPLPWLTGRARYSYDDVYQDLFQPATVAARLHGHYAWGELEAVVPKLPFRLALGGHAGGRFVAPENRSVELSGTVMFGLWRFISAGYFGQWLSWNRNDPAYWSPQGYAAHMFVAKIANGHPKLRLDYELQASVGAARERISVVPDTGEWAVAFGAAGALLWQPHDRIHIKLTLQYGQTVRYLAATTTVVPPTGEQPMNAGAPASPTLMPQLNTYWWLASMLALTIVL